MRNSKKVFKLLLATAVLIVATFAYSVSFAQDDSVGTIKKQFDNYQQNNLQEKLFVHTDRNSYVSGELLWFKIYCVNAADNQLLDLSKVGYAEILNKDNQPVMQAKVALQNGTGNGSITIPSTLSSGNYTFRSYTNWMKNFDPGFYFQKTLTIINTIREENSFSEKTPEKFDFHFFPEGGDLVSGLESKVAFTAANVAGGGIVCNGAIVSQANDTVVRFKTTGLGIGSFVFTPVKGNSYRAIAFLPNEKPFTQELPQIQDNGFVLAVTDTGNDGRLVITVKSNLQEQVAYLVIHSQQHISDAQVVHVTNGQAQTQIDKNKLADGVSNITLFNSNNQPVCERLYFKKPQKKLVATVKADERQYDIRTKVSIDVEAKNEAGKPVAADMSMAVYLADSSSIIDADIYNYLWLSSDLQSQVRHPEQYFISNLPASNEALDNLMLTQGWRRFKWEDVIAGKKPILNFLPEYEGHIVTGKVTNEAGVPQEKIVAYLSVPGTDFQLYTAQSKGDGSIYFNTKDFYGTKLIVAQANAQEDSKYRVNLLSPFSEIYSTYKTPVFNNTTLQTVRLLPQSISMQVKNIFAQDSIFSLPAPVDTNHFFGKPGFRYMLEDYTRFPTMEEVLREYVREINVRKRRDKFRLTMVTKNEFGFAEIKDPVVLLDGVPQFDNGNRITHYDPLKVKELQIIQDKYYYGPATFNGIASFTTYKGNLEGFQMDTAATVVDYDALQLKREFYSPKYDTKDRLTSRIPDFRNLLYWTPELKTTESGKQQVNFYTSDQPGKYVVVLQGISASGRVGSSITTFEVKKKNEK